MCLSKHLDSTSRVTSHEVPRRELCSQQTEMVAGRAFDSTLPRADTVLQLGDEGDAGISISNVEWFQLIRPNYLQRAHESSDYHYAIAIAPHIFPVGILVNSFAASRLFIERFLHDVLMVRYCI